MNAPADINFITNLGNQPLELHLNSGLRVLGPRGRTQVAAADLESPQLLVLRRGRVVMVSHAPAPEPPEPDAQAAENPPSRAKKAPAQTVQDAKQPAAAAAKPGTSEAEA